MGSCVDRLELVWQLWGIWWLSWLYLQLREEKTGWTLQTLETDPASVQVSSTAGVPSYLDGAAFASSPLAPLMSPTAAGRSEREVGVSELANACIDARSSYVAGEEGYRWYNNMIVPVLFCFSSSRAVESQDGVRVSQVVAAFFFRSCVSSENVE